jgi:hypothetical protein
MNPRPYPYGPRPHVQPLPPQEDAFTKYAPFVVAIPLVLSVAAVFLPALLIGGLGFVLAAVFRLRWWTLVAAGVVALAIVIAMGINPVKRVEKVIRRTQTTWTIGKPDKETGLAFANKGHKKKQGNIFDRLAKRVPSLFGVGLPAAIPLGLLLAAIGVALLLRDRESLGLNADVQRSRQTRKGRKKARRRVGSTPESIRGRMVLGPAVAGDLQREWLARKLFRGEFVVYGEPNLGRHIVIVGQPGSGKTVTMMQLAYLAAKVYGWRVFFLDGKGDVSTQREFIATMLHAGLHESQVGVFPAEPFDGWRTTGMLNVGFTQLLNRLLGVVQFTEPYYEDAARAFVGQALMLEGSLPESSDEFLKRLECLIKASAVEQRREAMGTLLRYRAFFDSFNGKLDGSWTFEDKHAAYVLLEGAAQPKEAGRLAAYLFESFKQFAAQSKDPSDRALLIVDEFPAVQEDADVAGLVERLRSFGCSVALTAQSYEGLGTAKSRIIQAARSVIVHSSPGAEEIVRLAGTYQSYAVTSQIDYDRGPTGRGSATPEQRFRVDPNLLGSLHDGEAFVIAQRRAHLVRVAKRSLPEQVRWRADEMLRPKVQVERLAPELLDEAREAELERAIDW